MLCIPAATRRSSNNTGSATRGREGTMMKQLIIATALPMVFSCSSGIDLDRVAVVERARAEAIAHHDASAYSRLVADDLMMTDRTGDLLTKGDRIAAVDSGRAGDT